jgi:hypothetical protein
MEGENQGGVVLAVRQRMNARRTVLALGLVGIMACGDAASMAPTSPVAATTFALKGAVMVSAPSNVPLGGVTVTILDGPSAGQSVTTDQNGVFGFAGLSGAATLRAASAGYQTQTIALDMSQSRSITVEMKPEAKILQESLTRANSNAGACEAACRIYTLDIHNDGSFEATLSWPSFTSSLKLSLWRGDTLMMTSTHVGTLREAFMTPVPVTGGFEYQLRVTVMSGTEPPDFTVLVRRPN